MMGLAVLLFFAVYLLVSIWAVNKTVGWAKANDRKPWLWGGLAAFVMYNLIFWDFIPTLVAHKYYCSTQAGFWVYKTPEQWKVENTGIVETLVATPSKAEKLQNGWIRYWVNQRIFYEAHDQKNFAHAIWREDKQIIDARTKQILAKVINFYRGVSGNVLAMGGTMEDFRQALILGWGERSCASGNNLLTHIFAKNLNNYSKQGEKQ